VHVIQKKDEPMGTDQNVTGHGDNVHVPHLEEHIASSHGQSTDVTPTPFLFFKTHTHTHIHTHTTQVSTSLWGGQSMLTTVPFPSISLTLGLYPVLDSSASLIG
jgi:hypothetical protein